MKLKEYIASLQAILESSGDLELIYSKDEEGNAYTTVAYEPSVVLFDTVQYELVVDDDEIEDFDVQPWVKVVVCIN